MPGTDDHKGKDDEGAIAETLGDPYKGKIPLPSVPYYQAQDLSRHLTRMANINTPNLNGH